MAENSYLGNQQKQLKPVVSMNRLCQNDVADVSTMMMLASVMTLAAMMIVAQ